MQNKKTKDFLGCQIWLEPTDSLARVDRIFQEAANSGLGWARIFLMWPMIEAIPDEWDFEVFDLAFEAAARYGIRIKATLTANSGPWHIGTPSVLHTHSGFLDEAQKEPMKRYIHACVKRYSGHPALGQWILWNEPGGGTERTDESLQHWRRWLIEKYNGNLQQLNKRWRTGYIDFETVPFPEDIPHDVHKGDFWNSYKPWLDDWESRALWLNNQIEWVSQQVREIDSVTETCVNPVPLLSNLAENGMDLQRMGEIVDIIGSSHHPSWLFTFADRSIFSALMVAGVQMQRAYPSIRRVEVTEVQTGNTVNSSKRPCNVTPSEVLRHYLSCIAAGAESVTGWLLNTRSVDFEAGDWGLLDDMDRPTERSRMVRLLHDKLEHILPVTGEWQPSRPNVWIAMDPHSQALEWVEAKTGPAVPGRMVDDGANGASLLAVCGMQCGLNTMLARTEDLPADGSNGGIIVLSHLVALEVEAADRILAFVDSGGCLLMDGTSGRKDRNAALHRPWPGGLADRIGLVAKGLDTRPEGFEMMLNGLPAGRWLLTRLEADLDPEGGWMAWPELRFTHDGEPCVWERKYGKGKIVVARGMLGPSLAHQWDNRETAKYIFSRIGERLRNEIIPVPGDPVTFVVPVQTERGSLSAVFTSIKSERMGKDLFLQADDDNYQDLWTGVKVQAGPDRTIRLPAEDGVILLWREK